MKKILMVAAMMLMSIGAFAQNEVGQITLKPTVGMNLATVTSADNAKMKVGLIAGFEGEYGISENLGLSLGALYSMEGAKQGDAKFNFDYINVPLLLQVYPAKGFAVKAGAQVGFNVRHKVSDGDNSMDINDFYKALGVDTKVQSVNFSIPLGLSYQISDFVIDARYNLGISKIFKNTDEGRGSVISITVGYKFPL